jgi:hypothetical protein
MCKGRLQARGPCVPLPVAPAAPLLLRGTASRERRLMLFERGSALELTQQLRHPQHLTLPGSRSQLSSQDTTDSTRDGAVTCLSEICL